MHTKESWKHKWCGVGRTDKGKIACVSYSRKERAADGGLTTASKRDSETGRELIQANLEK